MLVSPPFRSVNQIYVSVVVWLGCCGLIRVGELCGLTIGDHIFSIVEGCEKSGRIRSTKTRKQYGRTQFAVVDDPMVLVWAGWLACKWLENIAFGPRDNQHVHKYLCVLILDLPCLLLLCVLRRWDSAHVGRHFCVGLDKLVQSNEHEGG